MAITSTLGPRGMNKMLVDNLGDITVTNDGAKILEELEVEHPTARMVKEMAKTIKKNLGDGSLTAVILLGELMAKTQEMTDNGLSPVHIYEGFRNALKESNQILDEMAIKINNNNLIKQCALTALNTKIEGDVRDLFADIVVEAISHIKEEKEGSVSIDLDNIQIIKKHGEGIKNTSLIQGLIIDKEVVDPTMPKSLKNAKIALIDAALEIVKTEITAEIKINKPGEIDKYLKKEEKILKEQADLIHAAGANVVFCQKGIDDTSQTFLSKYGIMAIRRVKNSDMVKLSLATGAKIITQIKSLTSIDLGNAGSISEQKIGKDNMIFVEGCKDPKAITVLIRGGNEQIVDGAERALKNGLGVVKVLYEVPYIVGGGGSTEIELRKQLIKRSQQVGGKQQTAIENFADALEIIPKTLVDNSGKNSLDILTELRAVNNFDKKQFFSFDAMDGSIKNVNESGIWDSLQIKKQIYTTVTELAIVLIRIDDIIRGQNKKPAKA
jgi:thermosome